MGNEMHLTRADLDELEDGYRRATRGIDLVGDETLTIKAEDAVRLLRQAREALDFLDDLQEIASPVCVWKDEDEENPAVCLVEEILGGEPCARCQARAALVRAGYDLKKKG